MAVMSFLFIFHLIIRWHLTCHLLAMSRLRHTLDTSKMPKHDDGTKPDKNEIQNQFKNQI